MIGSNTIKFCLLSLIFCILTASSVNSTKNGEKFIDLGNIFTSDLVKSLSKSTLATSNSSNCGNDLNVFFDQLQNGQKWAQVSKLVDSAQVF